MVSTEPEIRQVPAEDKLPWLRAMRTTLLVNPAGISEAGLAWWDQVWDADRITGSYHEGRCVATLRTFPTPLSVPCGADERLEIPIDALTQVTVAATHRRRGLLTGMLTRSLRRPRSVARSPACSGPPSGRSTVGSVTGPRS